MYFFAEMPQQSVILYGLCINRFSFLLTYYVALFPAIRTIVNSVRRAHMPAPVKESAQKASNFLYPDVELI